MEDSTSFGKFFNEKISITLEERKEANLIIDHLRRFPRITSEFTYIVDLTCNSIVYASKGLCFLCNRTEEELTGRLYKFHRDFFIPTDSKKVEKLRIQGHKLLSTNDKLLEDDFCLRFNFHLVIDGHARLFHYNAVPFMRTQDGSLWMVLCTLAPSSLKDTGYATLHINANRQYFEFDFNFSKWIEKEMPVLTKIEKEIISLSAQGYTEIDMAAKINKSHNTLKTYKRNIFRKLQVSNIAETIMFCLNHNLI